MNIAFIFVAFLVVALVLWGVAELRYRNFNYEEDKPHHPDPTAHQGGEYQRLLGGRLIHKGSGDAVIKHLV